MRIEHHPLGSRSGQRQKQPQIKQTPAPGLIKNKKMDTNQATISAAENLKAIESHKKAAQHFQEAAKYHSEAAKFHESGEIMKAEGSLKKAVEHSKTAIDLQNADLKLHEKYKK